MPLKKSRKTSTKKSTSYASIARDLVRKANEQENPFSELIAFQTFSRNGLDLNLVYEKVSKLSPETVQWAFDLLKRNLKTMYEQTQSGWNERAKYLEMTDASARYLIAYNTEGKPLGYSHFRFDMDYGSPVLYCYELQLEVECRRSGLGRFMLQVLELMAFRANLEKVVLTVFMQNTAARSFFRSCGYSLDDTSPAVTGDSAFDYQILSKRNMKRTN
nr:EOG090X0MNC [Leptodora kindtii]